MKHTGKVLALILMIVSSVAKAENITVCAADPNGKAINGVKFRFLNTRLFSPPTLDGCTGVEIMGNSPGQSAEIGVSSVKERIQKWVFIRPWDRKVVVPAHGEIVRVVLARKVQQDLLESDEAVKAMVQSILSAFYMERSAQQPLAEEQRICILAEQADYYGLSVKEIEKAIRSWGERAQDPYDIGIAALYERNYTLAVKEFSESLSLRKEQENETKEKIAESAYFLGNAYYDQGYYNQAVKSYRQAAEQRQDDALFLKVYGLALLVTAKYPEAEAQLKKAISINEKVFGPDHLDVAACLNNLALLYKVQGKYGLVEPLLRRSLAISEKVLGPNQQDMALSLNNLALLYNFPSGYAQAETLSKRSLAIGEMILGPDHPYVATSLYILALLCEAQSQNAQAESLYRQSLAIREKSLGPEHLDVVKNLHHLAMLYKTQGQYAQAESLYTRALAISEKALGPDHPYVAINLNSLSLLYHSQGNYYQAELLLIRSLAISEKTFGPDHPYVATCLEKLAELYRATKNKEKATKFANRAKLIRELKRQEKTSRNIEVSDLHN